MTDPSSPKKKLSRRRRANVAGGRERKGEVVHSHRVLVTAEEEALLVKLAAQQRVSVPRLLMERALSERETSTERRDAMAKLFAFRRQLTGLATNVNQLARAANTDGHTPVGTAAAIAEVRAVVEKIDAAIDELATS